jgi:arylsulfatase A-like enzyme
MNLFWATVLCILSFQVLGCVDRSERRDPDIFLFVIDTLRADHLGSDGDQPSISPNIDRFAKESFRYERAYAQSSWTKTSMASLFTGVYPYRHRVFNEEVEGGRLPEAVETLAEILKTRGYRTIALSSNPHIQRRTGFAQGFDTFRSNGSWRGKTTEPLSRMVREQLDLADREERHFFYIHYLDPHDPWRCPPEQEYVLPDVEVTHPWVRAGEGFRLSGEAELGGKLATGVVPVPAELDKDALAYLRGLYDCEISNVDRAFGEILAKFEREGWLDTSIIILTSDHGEEFLDHGMLRHGYQLFDETIHVPLLIRTPNLIKESNRKQPPHSFRDIVELVDIVPTVLSLLVPPSPPVDLDGDILPGFGSETSDRKRSRAFGMTAFRRQHKAYVISDDAKLIWDFTQGRGSLFDLNRDALEVAGQDPTSSPEGRRLLQELSEWESTSKERAYSADDTMNDIDSDDEDLLRRQLEELGYIE